MPKLVIIGGDSYIATGLERYFADYEIIFLYYYNWREHLDDICQADCVINFSIAPDFSQKEIELSDVLDIQLAELLEKCNTQYVFISSRKVYGSTKACVTHKETDCLSGVDFYARNKIKTEKALSALLENHLTILRIANVIGEPVCRKGYKTFIGWICESYLETGQLQVTQNADSVKDFITKDFIHQCLSEIVRKRILGVYNLSSGFGTSVKDVLAGYVGAENLVLQPDPLPLEDQFILDNSLLKAKIGKFLKPEHIEQALEVYRNQLHQLRKDYIKDAVSVQGL